MAKEPCTIIAITIGLLIAVNENTIVSFTQFNCIRQKMVNTDKIVVVFFLLLWYLATPLSSPGCEYAFGIYPDSDDCSTSYLKCAFGEPSQHHCDAGLGTYYFLSNKTIILNRFIYKN